MEIENYTTNMTPDNTGVTLITEVTPTITEMPITTHTLKSATTCPTMKMAKLTKKMAIQTKDMAIQMKDMAIHLTTTRFQLELNHPKTHIQQ